MLEIQSRAGERLSPGAKVRSSLAALIVEPEAAKPRSTSASMTDRRCPRLPAHVTVRACLGRKGSAVRWPVLIRPVTCWPGEVANLLSSRVRWFRFLDITARASHSDRAPAGLLIDTSPI